MATSERGAESIIAGDRQYEATSVVNEDARIADLPQGAVAPSEREVPASLEQLLATHGSEARLDSRRYLRKAQWSRIVSAAHALAVAVLPVEVAVAVGGAPVAVVGVLAGVAAGATVVLSQRSRVGRHPLREMVAAAFAGTGLAVVSGIMPGAMVLAGADAAVAGRDWRLCLGGLAIAGAATVVAGLCRGRAEQSAPRVVRFAAAMSAVAVVLACAN